ncbi:MAG TPA: hypothetical protein VMV90_08365 [Rectinemataceae bacterium]|nr:hypothetical protein [Rectinemataceae bacterium]
MKVRRSFSMRPAANLFAVSSLLMILASCALQPAPIGGSINVAIPTAALSRAIGAGPSGSNWVLYYAIIPDAEYASIITANPTNGLTQIARPVVSEFYGSSPYVMGEVAVGSQFDDTSNTNGTPNTQYVAIEGIPPRKQVNLIIQLWDANNASYPDYWVYSCGYGNTYAWIYRTQTHFDITEGALTTVNLTNYSFAYFSGNNYTC